MALQFPGVPASYTGQQMGMPDLFAALMRGVQAKQQMQMFPEELQKMQLANAISRAQAENAPELEKARAGLATEQQRYYGPNIISEMNLRNAQTGAIPSEIALRQAQAGKINMMSPLEAEELRLKNQFYPDLTRSQIELHKGSAQAQLANAYLEKEKAKNLALGGGDAGGVNMQNIAGLKRQIAVDNPDWKPDKINAAANAYILGQDKLASGEQLPSPSGISQSILDFIAKTRTTAPILTSNIKTDQSEAELGTLEKYAQEGIKPFGSTIMGYSPEQVLATFNTDKKSQLALGKFIASQAVLYEIMQGRIRQAMGQPGVKSTEELMELSGQRIKGRYPILSYEARHEADRYLSEALKAGVKARKTVSSGAAQHLGGQQNISTSNTETKEKPTRIYNQQTGELEYIK